VQALDAKYDAIEEDLANRLLDEADKIRPPHDPKIVLTSAGGLDVLAKAIGILLGEYCIEAALDDMKRDPEMTKDEAAVANWHSYAVEEAEHVREVVLKAAHKVVSAWVEGEPAEASASVHQFPDR
jgi:hypothetical protein